MDLTPEIIEAADAAYVQAASEGREPIRPALEAAFAAILKPVSRDLHKKWTTLEALAVYSEAVRPKTYTLYDDAMKRTAGRYAASNLYLMMSLLIGQTLHDLYTTVLDMGNEEKYPTEMDFVVWYFDSVKKGYDTAERQQSVIDAMKPPSEDKP